MVKAANDIFVIPERGLLPASPESIFADLWLWIPELPLCGNPE